MSNVLLLSIPSHGHMNPLLGLANELVNHSEDVIFFSSEEFKQSVEAIGAHFTAYKEDMNIFQKKPGEDKPKIGLAGALLQPKKFIDDVLAQIGSSKFDYIVFSAAYPYANAIAQILNIPAVSSFAVFMPMKELLNRRNKSDSEKGKGPLGITPDIMDAFKTILESLTEKYKVTISENLFDLFINKGDLNIIYTSEYFIGNREEYDDSFIFVGPPVYKKKYNIDFPFEKLEGKKVIYISMGTIFGNHSTELNQLFFESFANTDYTVVMAAHDVDTAAFNVPDNFIIRDFVPQLELLKYTSVAITHAGMNSIGDLLYNNIPFVSIPLGADQFYLANRASQLGATIVLDAKTLTPEAIREAVESVTINRVYLENIRSVSLSFKEAGGYKRAVAEIFKLKKEKGIVEENKLASSDNL